MPFGRPNLPPPPARKPQPVDEYAGMPASAFWLWPDWQYPSGSDNLRDPGSEPFWMRKPTNMGSTLAVKPYRSGSSNTNGR